MGRSFQACHALKQSRRNRAAEPRDLRTSARVRHLHQCLANGWLVAEHRVDQPSRPTPTTPTIVPSRMTVVMDATSVHGHDFANNFIQLASLAIIGSSRVGGDEFQLSQEALADHAGLGRPTVSAVAGTVTSFDSSSRARRSSPSDLAPLM